MTRETDDRFPLLRNRLKDRIRSHQLSLCLRMTLGTTGELAFAAQASGFDALYVDLEHSTTSVADAARLCATATALGITPLVRLSSSRATRP
jgi:4-hydroxy-2-oxoheptanedioate aldolase